MDIRKGKVEKNRVWSANAQKVLASFLGVSAISMLAACVPVDSVAGGEVDATPPSPDPAQMTSGDVAYPESSASVSSSSVSQPQSSSSVESAGGTSSSSFYDPPLAGVIEAESSISSEVSSSSRHVDISYPMSSGMPMNYLSSSSFTRSSSSSLMPPTSGVSMPYEPVSSSSSYRVDSLEITAGEIVPPVESSSSSFNNEEPPPLAGIPELSSSSSEPEPLPGDPIELPEPLSGDVPPGDVIYIDDPKD